MPRITIRPAGEGDIPAVVALYRQLDQALVDLQPEFFCVAKMLDKTSSIICAFGLASAAPRSPYRHLELCGVALNTILFIIGDCTMVRKRICAKQEKRLLLLEIKVMYNKASIYLW